MTEKKKEEPPKEEPPKEEPPAEEPPKEEPPKEEPPKEEPPKPDEEEEEEEEEPKHKRRKSDNEEYEYLPGSNRAVGLPSSKLFWFVMILMILNIVILAASKGGSFGKITDGLKQLSKVFWIETVVIIAFGAIPGVNMIILFIALPVFFFNVWTKLAPLLIDFNKAGAVPAGTPLTSANSISIDSTPDNGSLRSSRKIMTF